MKPCAWGVLREGEFGALPFQVSHPDPGRRMNCLRAGVRLLLTQAVSEQEFLAARKTQAEFVARWYRPSPSIWPFDGPGLVHSALRAVYQKGSPLHQIYSTGSDDVLSVSFEEFQRWLRHCRDEGLIEFFGERKLLEALGVPTPDPMVLRIVPSLESPRLPAGIYSFEEGERFRIPALIVVKLYPDGLDQEIGKRLSCNRSGPVQLEDSSARDAIAAISCDIFTMLNNEDWAFFFVTKTRSAGYPDFCRQVQALTKDTDIAMLVRFSAEGTKGLYILQPPQCVAAQ